MKCKTDENLPAEVVDLLIQSGHDAISVIDQNLSGKPDDEVARVCQSEQRVIITLDLDFADIRAYPPANYSGIIILRPESQTISRIVQLMSRVLFVLETEPIVGRLWIVDEHRVRIRE